MGSGELLPKGGFWRGVLAGTAFSVVIVIALSTAFDSPAIPPEVRNEPAPVITPPADPVASAPAFGAAQPAPVTPATPAPVAATPANDSPAPQDSPVAPVTAPLETAAVAPAAAQDSPQPVGETSAPLADSAQPAPEIGATTDIENDSVTPTPPVGAANAGFGAPAETGGEDAGLTTIAGNDAAPVLPNVSAPAQLGANAAPVESAPTTTASAAQPTGGFTFNGQTLIQPSASEDTAEVPQVSASTDAGKPFEVNAQRFTATGDQPLLSIVLQAETPEQAAAVAALSDRIVLAVPVDSPDAAALITQYRANGGEALLLLPADGPEALHKGDDPATAARMVADDLARFPAVIGILDGPEGDLPEDANLLAGILATLSDKGYGLVTTNAIGLNRADIMAKEAGVPSTGIARRIDAMPGKIPVIRLMDKTVLETADGGHAVVFGHASVDVLAALKFWLKSNKAQRVTIAPVSAIMKAAE